jgi:hypothetical protein
MRFSVMRTENAMVVKTMAAARSDWRKRSRTRKMTTAATSARFRRSESWVRTASLSSWSRIRRTPGGGADSRPSTLAFTASATRTTLVPISLWTVKLTAGKPSIR